jgi:hypothetical protein
MKKLLFAAGILVLAISCNQPVKGKNGVVYKSATDYNDFIVNRQTTIMKNVVEFVDASKTDLDSASALLDVYVADIDKMISEIREMPPYKGDSTLRDAAVNSFAFYKQIFSNEYKDLLRLRKSGEAETQEGVDEMNRIVDKITRDEEKYDKAFHNAQRDFAKKNNMRLKDNEMQKEIDKLNQE